MANPTVTIEIKEVGAKAVLDKMKLVRQEAGKLAGAKKRLSQRVKKTKTNMQELAVTSGKTGKAMRNLGSAAIFAVGPLSGVGARLVAFGAIAERTNIRVAAFAAGLAATTVAMVKIIGASIRAALAFQKIISSLTVATGSLFAAKDAFEFVKGISLELGLSLEQSAGQFSQLAAAAKGTALEGEEIRKVFLGTSKAAVALNLSVDQVTGVFRALQQMISKGTVQAEELRGQLGERLPGAFQIAAIAMKTTTAGLGKMLEMGEVLAEDLLPKLGEEFEKRFAKQATVASGNLQAALNRLTTATFLFSLELDDTIKSGQLATGILDKFSSTILALKDNMSSLVAVVAGISAAFGLMAAPAIIRGLVKLVLWIKRITMGVFALGLAIATTPLGFFITLGRVAAAAIGGALAFFAFRDSIEDTSTAQVGLIADLETFIALVKEAEGATRASVDAQIALTERRIKTIQIEIKALEAFINLSSAGRKPLEVITLPDITSEREIPEIFSAPSFDLPALRGFIEGVTDAFKSMFPDTPVEEAREKLGKFNTEMERLLELLKEQRDLPITPDTEISKIDKLIEKLEIQVDAMERLNAARREGEEVLAAMTQQLDLEANLRKLGAKATSTQVAELTRLIERKHAAIAVAKALTEAERETEKARRKAEAEEKRIERLRGRAQDQLQSIERANEVLRKRIDGLEEEARNMEIRNALEDKYGGVLLPKTIEALVKAQKEQDNLKNKLEQVDEVREILSSSFKQLGSDIASAIREGASIVDVFTNALGNLLERLLEVAIQLLIIGPLLKGLGLPGGSAFPTGALGGFVGGASSGGGLASLPFIPMAGGADFTVRGRGGVDTNLVPLRLTAGEHVKVTPAGESGEGSKTTIINLYLPPGMTAREFGDSDGQIGAMVASNISTAAQSNG